MKNDSCFYPSSGHKTHESKSAAIFRLFLFLKFTSEAFAQALNFLDPRVLLSFV